MIEARQREILVYRETTGRLPYQDWFRKLRDVEAKAIILTRLARVRAGNMGNFRSVGHGVLELKIDYGPGYRVYFGISGTQLVILLCGGDKRTQDANIQKAKAYWRDYQKRKDAIGGAF